MSPLKIASWNVNSLQARRAHVSDWLAKSKPDVLAAQETKTEDANFDTQAFEKLGYNVVFCGQKAYNGVAIFALGKPEDVLRQPAFPDSGDDKRVIAATVGGIRIINVYVVNGSEVGSEKYAYKLKWLKGLAAFLQDELARHPNCIVLGDFNVAPTDADVCDPAKWEGALLCSDKERAAYAELLQLGLVDTFRLFQHRPDETFSWWDYRGGGFNKNHGLRIDLILASAPLAETCITSAVDREPRGWDKPSDHTPVVATFAPPRTD